ncbi:S-adenosyl-L-methionine-dependent methyltransferase [Absidia repens]|uniref:S-adenosyl-L-methionine-dependent methyltransferase n=1 Tax=Absidia repens TaxID=90262 RepID=A0A1X2ICN6_9FUNG|nr:S-adenosyl-L-methionine-dependent methyltransferase [Absidia repens]
MSLQQPHSVASNGFQNGSDLYALSRPKYPLEAIEYIKTIVPENSKILDLAAGTGIMTKLLVDAHYQVAAVEPVAGMRDQLRQTVPGVTVTDGTSWDTALPSESQDAIIIAQAFHWFDDLKTLQEMHRILKPNGKLLLIWNLECKKNSRWVQELRDLYEVYDAEVPQYRKNNWKKVWQTQDAQALFNTPLQYQHFDYNMPTTRDNVFKRILSKSYIAVLPKEEQARLEKKVNAILDDPELGFVADPVTGQFIYPHDTDLFWAQKK